MDVRKGNEMEKWSKRRRKEWGIKKAGGREGCRGRLALRAFPFNIFVFFWTKTQFLAKKWQKSNMPGLLTPLFSRHFFGKKNCRGLLTLQFRQFSCQILPPNNPYIFGRPSKYILNHKILKHLRGLKLALWGCVRVLLIFMENQHIWICKSIISLPEWQWYYWFWGAFLFKKTPQIAHFLLILRPFTPILKAF